MGQARRLPGYFLHALPSIQSSEAKQRSWARSIDLYFHQHPDIEGAYMLDTQRGKVPVTFRRSVLDMYAPEGRLLTYATDEVSDLLANVGVEAATADGLPQRWASSNVDLPRSRNQRQ